MVVKKKVKDMTRFIGGRESGILFIEIIAKEGP